MSVEKNDVDISNLFSWGTAFEIIGKNEEVESMVFMRLVGDEDLNKARVYALRESADIRRKLKEEGSDENLAFIPRKGDIDSNGLVDMVALFSTREITRKAVRDVKVTIPVRPSDDASLEKMEEYQSKIDSYQVTLDKERLAYITEAVDRLKKKLATKTSDELYKAYISSLIHEFCEQASFTAFKDAVTYYGSFSDSLFTKKYFSSVKQLLTLPTEMKVQFISAYQTLEIGGEELKKLRVATL